MSTESLQTARDAYILRHYVEIREQYGDKAAEQYFTCLPSAQQGRVRQLAADRDASSVVTLLSTV